MPTSGSGAQLLVTEHAVLEAYPRKKEMTYAR